MATITDVLIDHQLNLDMADVYEEEALLYLDIDLVTAFDHYRRSQALRKLADQVLDTPVPFRDREAPARFLITEDHAEAIGPLYLSTLWGLISDTEVV